MCASLHYFVFIYSPKGITITHVSPFEKKNSSSWFQYKRKRHATRTQTSWNQFKIPVVKNWPIKKNLKRNNCDGIPSNSLPQCWVLWKANNRCLTSWKEQVELTAIFGFKKKIKWFRPHVKPWSTKCSLERPAKEKNFTGVFRHHVAHLSIGDHSSTWWTIN